MREVTGREDVRDEGSAQRRGVSGFCEVQLDERPMFPFKFAERMEGLANACTLGPTRAGSGGEGHHADLPARKHGKSFAVQRGIVQSDRVEHIGVAYVNDLRVGT